MYFSKSARKRNRENRRQFEFSKTRGNQVRVNFDYDMMVRLLMRGTKDEFVSYASSCEMDADWIASTWNTYRKDPIESSDLTF